MKAIRKKKSMLKEIIKSEVVIWIVGLAFTIFVVGWPREFALDFFLMIENFHIDRIYLGFFIFVLTIIFSVIILFLLVKEVRWNNHNLSLAPIELSDNKILINNYVGKETIDVSEIAEIKIMNNDTVLQLKTKDGKVHHPENLKNTREVYESIKEAFLSEYPSITFLDSANKD